MTLVQPQISQLPEFDAPSSLPARRLIVVLTAIAGAAVTLLVAHDGSPGWQLVRVGTVVLATGAALVAELRLGDRGCGRLAAAVGVLVLATCAGFAPYVAKDVLSVEALAGGTAFAAGVALAVTGTVRATRGRHIGRRIVTGAVVLAGALLLTFVVGSAVAATNVPRPQIGATPADRGLDHEPVTLTTADGVRLAAWYLPSTNRAAVVLLHGAGSTRSNVLDEAAVLARHGFGVLMVDARGHGESEGRAMDFGWHGDADIAAATRYLADRPDVDDERIGVVGSSMGGEEAIGASATNDVIRAVVAEGATARTAADEAWLSDEFGFRGFVQEQLERLQDWVTDLLTSASPPVANDDAVRASGDTRYLLITAGHVADERHAAEYVASAGPDRVEIWTAPGAGHTDGLATEPEEWERRVIDFLTDTLLSPQRG